MSKSSQGAHSENLLPKPMHSVARHPDNDLSGLPREVATAIVRFGILCRYLVLGVLLIHFCGSVWLLRDRILTFMAGDGSTPMVHTAGWKAAALSLSWLFLPLLGYGTIKDREYVRWAQSGFAIVSLAMIVLTLWIRELAL